MRILVACEESQRVTMELRKLGHEAYSCDIMDESGGHPEWHIKQDVLPLLNGNCEFADRRGGQHKINGKWDMIIAFPPCTHLAVSGGRHFEKKRADGRQREGIEFFCQFLIADCDKISIENPVNIIGGNYIKKWFPDLCEKYGLPKKCTQIIEPWMFGDPYAKKTCLWLKNLPKLVPTDIVELGKKDKNGFVLDSPLRFARDENGKILAWNDPRTGQIRSKTYPGIAHAMATQFTAEE